MRKRFWKEWRHHFLGKCRRGGSLADSVTPAKNAEWIDESEE
jgi:hypothetical protein